MGTLKRPYSIANNYLHKVNNTLPKQTNVPYCVNMLPINLFRLALTVEIQQVYHLGDLENLQMLNDYSTYLKFGYFAP